MASAAVSELRKKSDAASANLAKQLEGMEAHADKPEAPGEWTPRQGALSPARRAGRQPGAPAPDLRDLEPARDRDQGGPREKMTLAQLRAALETQRRDIFAYLETLGDPDLARKATIPLFKQFMGTDEIALPVFVGAMFDYHWNDHAGQIAKIRKAAGLPEAK